MNDSAATERRRRVRRGALALGLVALALYAGFILMSVARGLP